jgi:hypothetical protein
MQSLKKYLFEGFLIVFSVLFALFIDNYQEQRKIQQQKKLAMERIKLELLRNQKITREWIIRHGEILEHLKVLSKLPKDSLKLKFSSAIT